MKENNIIHLRGLEFYGYHGLMPEERVTGQKFLVDLDLFMEIDGSEIIENIEDTVNYAEVFEVVRKIVENEQYQLLETLAGTIASRILRDFSCRAVRVEVHKPNAPIPGVFRDISVEMYREK